MHEVVLGEGSPPLFAELRHAGGAISVPAAEHAARERLAAIKRAVDPDDLFSHGLPL